MSTTPSGDAKIIDAPPIPTWSPGADARFTPAPSNEPRSAKKRDLGDELLNRVRALFRRDRSERHT